MEFLVFAHGHGEYELGDILDVRPDGFEWGYEEMADSIWEIVEIPDAEIGMTVEEARETFCVGIFGDDETDESGNTVNRVLRQSKWKITPAGNLVEKRKGPGASVQEVIDRAVTRRPVDHPVKRRTGPRLRPPLPGQAGGPGSRPNPRARGG